MKTIIICFILLVGQFSLSAQEVLYVNHGPDQNFQTTLKIEKGNTLYGIAQRLYTSVTHLKTINKKADGVLSLNELIRVPIYPSLLSHTQDHLLNPRRLYYVVERGDNLFRIARTARQKTADLLKINAKSSTELKIGEKIMLGWIDWPFEKNSKEDRPRIALEQIAIHRNSIRPLTTAFLAKSPPSYASAKQTAQENLIIKEKGIAFWDKGENTTEELVVMHPHARINSKISLYNPMLKRKVQATVVSELPSQTYAKDISVVISPSVANALGALDKRFLVEITYAE